MLSSVFERTNKAPWADRGWYLVTEFEKTNSLNFTTAVESAKTHPGFIQLMDERNILIYRNIYREPDLDQFQALYKLIKQWKGTRLYFKGDPVEFDLIESGIRCYSQARALNAAGTASGFYAFCEHFDRSLLDTSAPLGYLGCRRSEVGMHGMIHPALPAPSWFCFGRLNQHNVYAIHKDDLESTVIGHLSEYFACPLLNLTEIAEFIETFPDRLDPRKDKAWQYHPQRQPHVYIGHLKEPAVMPISDKAYRAYLKRKLSDENTLVSEKS